MREKNYKKGNKSRRENQPQVISSTPPIKKTGIKEFAQKPWVIIIGLVIAFIGGIPGIIQTIDFFSQKKPKFEFAPTQITHGQLSDSKDKEEYFIIQGQFKNSGNKRLFPSRFILKIHYDGKVINTNAFMFDRDTISLDLNGKKLIYSKASQSDMQKTKVIDPEQVIYGLLAFTTTINIDQIRESNRPTLELICIDFDLKEYTIKFPLLKDIDLKAGTVFPKDDLIITE